MAARMQSIAPKTKDVAKDNKEDVSGSFMEVARSIRSRIYTFLGVPEESCNVPKAGKNKALDNCIRDYLVRNRNITRTATVINSYYSSFTK